MSSLPAGLPEGSRRSHALEAFSSRLNGAEGLHVLDLGPASQANIDFITGFGHRLYSEDLLRSVQAFFPPEELAAGHIPPARVEEFLDLSLSFPDQSTDGALLWDTLQFLPPSLMQPAVDRLFRIQAPDSCMVALFLPEKAPPEAAPLHCRIVDDSHLTARPRPFRLPVAPLNNRSIERLFLRFQSVRFFLTRDNLREILVRR